MKYSCAWAHQNIYIYIYIFMHIAVARSPAPALARLHTAPGAGALPPHPTHPPARPPPLSLQSPRSPIPPKTSWQRCCPPARLPACPPARLPPNPARHPPAPRHRSARASAAIACAGRALPVIPPPPLPQSACRSGAARLPAYMPARPPQICARTLMDDTTNRLPGW